MNKTDKQQSNMLNLACEEGLGVGASFGCVPFAIDVYSHPAAFRCVRRFLSFFLNYFVPFPFFQLMSVTARKSADEKTKCLDLTITINECLLTLDNTGLAKVNKKTTVKEIYIIK